MKKLLLLLLLIIPSIVCASTYKAVDLSIDIDDNMYTVVTRDNLKGNTKLQEYNVTEEDLGELFIKQSTYIDAFYLNNEEEIYKEIFVTIKDADLKYNLHKYGDADLKKLEDEIIQGYNPSLHGIYKNDKYKYVYMYYKQGSFYIADYYTVINGKGYTIKLQSNKEFTDKDREAFISIISGIKFELDSKYEKRFNFNLSFIVALVFAAFAGGLTAYFTKRNNAKNK